MPHGRWDLGSPARVETSVPGTGRWILGHWITREVPASILMGGVVLQFPCNVFVCLVLVLGECWPRGMNQNKFKLSGKFVFS